MATEIYIKAPSDKPTDIDESEKENQSIEEISDQGNEFEDASSLNEDSLTEEYEAAEDRPQVRTRHSTRNNLGVPTARFVAGIVNERDE